MKYVILLIIGNLVIILFYPLINMTKASGKKNPALLVKLISLFALIKTPDIVGESSCLL